MLSFLHVFTRDCMAKNTIKKFCYKSRAKSKPGKFTPKSDQVEIVKKSENEAGNWRILFFADGSDECEE